MQVKENRNYYMNNALAFGAIKSVKCTGLYEQFPDLGKDLVDTFQSNPKAMDFCKKYDVDLVFSAIKTGWSSVQTTLHVFYDDLSKGKFKKFWQGLTSSPDEVSVASFSGSYNINYEDSLKATTLSLKQMIAPPGTKGYKGTLDKFLKEADDKLCVAYAKRPDIVSKNKHHVDADLDSRMQLEEETSKLEASIRNLIKKSR